MTEGAATAGDPVYLAAHLQEHLAADPRVQEPELVVSIRGGRIVVEGVVPTGERRAAIASVLGELCPGVEVDNRTTVADYDPSATQERIS